MGNPKMRTKPRIIREEDLHFSVKRTVEALMTQFCSNGISYERIEVPFGEVIFWESRPSFSDPHWTKITFHGHTNFQRAYARYEGIFGTWEIDLACRAGFPDTEEAARRWPAARTWGRARCLTPSGEWRETQEQRRERLKKWFEEGVL